MVKDVLRTGLMVAATRLLLVVAMTGPAAAVQPLPGITDHPDLNSGVELWRARQYEAAVALWLPLARAGDGEAQLFLGYAYKSGKGVPFDLQQSARWYQQAAEQGVPEAQMALGLIYELGLGVPRDPGEAARWYDAATGGEFCPADLPAGGRLGDG